jgi:hypothetical protein
MLPPGWRSSVVEGTCGELLLRASDGTTTVQRPLRLVDARRTWVELLCDAWANRGGFVPYEGGR